MRKWPPRRLRGKKPSAASQVAEATATYGIRRELGRPARPKLFDFGPNGGRNGAVFRDPAFMDNKTLPVHRWVPWIAGFSAGFVDDVLDSFLRGHGT
ncbi:MAG: hypothetical protein FJ272_16190, partial [Planctomycetes bacterium]|nr:hypothetical protein [Planctomycetota bacterium]